MFYENFVEKAKKKVKKKQYTIEIFQKNMDTSAGHNKKNKGQADLCYNFIKGNMVLQTGYGFTELKLPVAENSALERKILTVWEMPTAIASFLKSLFPEKWKSLEGI